MAAIIRRIARGGDRHAALRADNKREAALEVQQREEDRLRLAPFSRNRHGVYLGETPGPDNKWLSVTLPHHVAHATSGWITGATGTGKTTALLGWAAQDLVAPNCNEAYFDYQGAESGFAHQLTHSVIPGVAMRLPRSEAVTLLTNLRIVSPWQSRKLPSLNLTANGPDVNTRAAAVADVFAATTNMSGAGEFGPRMLSLTLPSTKLLIRNGVPFPLLDEAIVNDGFRQALVERCGDDALKSYFRNRFQADFRDARAAVLSRLDRFVADDATRLACFAPQPFDPTDWIERGTTVVNLGGATPMHRSFWAALIQTSIIGAILSRRPRRSSPRVIVRIDEAHIGLPSVTQARELDDALSRMRGRRAALSIAHQHAGQLSEFGFLRESLRANTGYCVTFRVPPNTFSAAGMTVPGTLLPGMRHGLSEAENQDVWERVVTNLPKRTFLLHSADVSNATIPVRAATFDVDGFGSTVSADIRDIAKEGSHGFERDELRRQEAVWRQAATELGAASDPNLDALERLARSPRERRQVRAREGVR